MLKRQSMIMIHVFLSSLFLPFLFLLPLSGGLALLKETGSQEKTEAFRTSDAAPEEKTDQEAFFRDQFQKQGLDFDFEYIRVSGNDFIFRPTSRDHYVATKTPDGFTFYRVEPSLLKRIMEIHKGHGPTFIKWVEVGFGMALMVVTISGLWLALSLPAYRKTVALAFAVGTCVIVIALL